MDTVNRLTPKILKLLELAGKGFAKLYFQRLKDEWIGNLNREIKSIQKTQLNSRTEKYNI